VSKGNWNEQRFSHNAYMHRASLLQEMFHAIEGNQNEKRLSHIAYIIGFLSIMKFYMFLEITGRKNFPTLFTFLRFL
jgi:hypothetical protein